MPTLYRAPADLKKIRYRLSTSLSRAKMIAADPSRRYDTRQRNLGAMRAYAVALRYLDLRLRRPGSDTTAPPAPPAQQPPRAAKSRRKASAA